jgi:hypothetical protein
VAELSGADQVGQDLEPAAALMSALAGADQVGQVLEPTDRRRAGTRSRAGVDQCLDSPPR